MSSRHWIIASSLGAILILAVGWGIYATGLQLGETKAKNAYHTSRYATHAADQIQSSCFGGESPDLAECVAEVIKATNEDQRAQDDLLAQTKMALWAFWMLVATIVMAGITFAGVIFVWQTLKATQDMARDTTRIGEAQVRAHINLTVSARWILDDENECVTGIRFDFCAKNSGASHAHVYGLFIDYAKIEREGEPRAIVEDDTPASRICSDPAGVTTTAPESGGVSVHIDNDHVVPANDTRILSSLILCATNEQVKEVIEKGYWDKGYNILIRTAHDYTDIFGRHHGQTVDFELPVGGYVPPYDRVKANGADLGVRQYGRIKERSGEDQRFDHDSAPPNGGPSA